MAVELVGYAVGLATVLGVGFCASECGLGCVSVVSIDIHCEYVAPLAYAQRCVDMRSLGRRLLVGSTELPVKECAVVVRWV